MSLRFVRFWSLGVATALVGLAPIARGQAAKPDKEIRRIFPQLSESLRKYTLLEANIGNEIAKAENQVKIKASEIPTISAPANAAPQLVSAEQRSLLLGKIGDFAKHVTSEEGFFTRWSVGLIIGAAVLALAGAILSFAKQHMTAGYAGLIVAAIISFSNAYPLNALSDFYRDLESKTSALQIDSELKQPFTADAYNSAANQLKLLYLYESKRPGIGNYKISPQLQSLTTELQTVKTSSDNLEKSRAVM
jgi:hypothetical protein